MELLHPDQLIATFGLLGVVVIVFVESGLLVGFFLPGDSLLFTAGLLAATGVVHLPTLLIGVAIAAIAGDQVGFLLGRRLGGQALDRDRWWTPRDHVARARTFFARRGGAAVLLARFVPVARTFVPFVAGACDMPYRAFVWWNVAGGLLWGVGVTAAGALLGAVVPDAERYLLPMIAVVVLLSVLPAVKELSRVRATAIPTPPPPPRSSPQPPV